MIQIIILDVVQEVSNSSAADPGSINFSLFGVIKIITALAGVLPLLVFTRNLWINRRKRLKYDLEILEKLNPSGQSYKTVSAYIDYEIGVLYKIPTKLKIHHWGEFLIGLLYLIVVALIGMWTYTPGSVWWWILVPFYSLNGIAIIFSSFLETSLLYEYFHSMESNKVEEKQSN